jgi:hypothetical protein
MEVAVLTGERPVGESHAGGRPNGGIMRISAALLGAALAAAFVSPVSATVRITSDPGGEIASYLQRFESLRLSGQHVIIDGACLSACTLVLGAIPRDHICVTPRARLGFHTAWRPDEFGRPVVSGEGTDVLMNNYPPQIRNWIMRRGGLSPRLMYLGGSELASMYPACREEDRSVVADRNVGSSHALSRPLTSNFAASRKAGRRPFYP